MGNDETYCKNKKIIKEVPNCLLYQNKNKTKQPNQQERLQKKKIQFNKRYHNQKRYKFEY
jgi:hypothetical protein